MRRILTTVVAAVAVTVLAAGVTAMPASAGSTPNGPIGCCPQ